MKREAERGHQLGVPSVAVKRSGRAGQMPPVSWTETKHNKPIRNKNKPDSGSSGMKGLKLGSIVKLQLLDMKAGRILPL